MSRGMLGGIRLRRDDGRRLVAGGRRVREVDEQHEDPIARILAIVRQG
jgi:hypothetical protein